MENQPTSPVQPTQPTAPTVPPSAWLAPPTPRPSHKLRNTLLGCGGAAALALIVLVIVVVASVATATSGGTVTPPANTSHGASTPAPRHHAMVGDTITFSGVAVTLNSVAVVAPGPDDQVPSAGDSYYALRVTLVNNSANVVDYNMYDFSVYNGAGASAPPPFLLSVPINQLLNSGNLAPGGKISGILLAELPTHDNGAKLVWNPLFFDNSINNAWDLGL